MEKFYQENKKSIWLILGFGAAAAAIAALVNANKKHKTRDAKSGAKTLGESVLKDAELTKLERANIVAGIKIQYEDSYLSVKTITEITEAVLRFASHDFAEFTRQDRQDRRAIHRNIEITQDAFQEFPGLWDRYNQLWEKYTQGLDDIIERNQKKVLQELNISEAVYEASNSHHIARNNQDLFMLRATLPLKLKQNLKSTKSLTEEEFKAVISYQILAIEQQADYLTRIPSDKKVDEVTPVVNNIVHDLTYSKYLVEEEDLLAALQLYGERPEIQRLFTNLQQANMKLFSLQNDIAV